MFLDASTIVAIVNNEERAEPALARIDAHTGQFFISPIVRFEAIALLARSRCKSQHPTASLVKASEEIVDRFVRILDAVDISITPSICQHALSVARTYGSMIGDTANLNSGACFAYACAKAYRAQLVSVGALFAETDLA